MPQYELVGGRLQVDGRLEDGDEEELRRRCLDLFLTGANVVTVDLSGVERICSRCVGTLVTLWIDLSAVGRELQLATSPAVKKVLDLSGLSSVLMARAGRTQFEIAGAELRVRGKLGEREYPEFTEQCEKLLRKGADVVTVDLSKAERVSSRCIGRLAALLIDLQGTGRDLRVIVSPSLRKFLELCGLAPMLLGEPGDKPP